MVSLEGDEYWEAFVAYWENGELNDYVWCWKCMQIIHTEHIDESVDDFHFDHWTKSITQKKAPLSQAKVTKPKSTKKISWFRCCPCRYNRRSKVLRVTRSPMNNEPIPQELIQKLCFYIK